MSSAPYYRACCGQSAGKVCLPDCPATSEKVATAMRAGFGERVVAHSLRVVAEEIRLGRRPPTQVATLLVGAADMIDALAAKVMPGYRPSKTLDDVPCPQCEEDES